MRQKVERLACVDRNHANANTHDQHQSYEHGLFECDERAPTLRISRIYKMTRPATPAAPRALPCRFLLKPTELVNPRASHLLLLFPRGTADVLRGVLLCLLAHVRSRAVCTGVLLRIRV